MKSYNRLLWELSQDPDEGYYMYGEILSEFQKAEKELLNELKSGKCLSRDVLKFRNKLNKLLANIPPFEVEEYHFLDKYSKESEVIQCEL